MADVQPSQINVRAPGFLPGIQPVDDRNAPVLPEGLAQWASLSSKPYELSLAQDLNAPGITLLATNTSDSQAAAMVSIPDVKPGNILLVLQDGVYSFVVPEPVTPHLTASILGTNVAVPTTNFRIAVSGTRPSVGADGLLRSNFLGGFVKTIVFWVVEKITNVAAPYVERKIKPVESFSLMPGANVTQAGGPVLVFTHGIFSSIQGAFKDLSPAFIQSLNQKYPGGIYGFDHWTVQKSPVDNARDLQQHLFALNSAPGSKIDLVCHSRGGAVHRSLLEHPSLVEGNKSLSFGSSYFVAGANQGSPLATISHIQHLVNAFLAMIQIGATVLGAPEVGAAIKFLGDLLLAAGTGLAEQPGVSDLSPTSTLYALLDGPDCTPMKEYLFTGASFSPAGALAKLGDLAINAAFYNQANDIVVPFAGTGTFDQYISPAGILVAPGPIFGTAAQPQSAVYHLNFFQQQAVQSAIQRL